jgi:hypothetical protein
MGKKPVLGLVGLCFGLALSGCKSDGCCGWLFSRKEQSNPPVARVKKPTDDGQVVRTRTAPDHSVPEHAITTLPTEEANRTKKAYDFDPRSGSVPGPAQQDLVETASKPAPQMEKETRPAEVATDPSPSPYLKTVSDKHTVTTPPAMVLPEQPRSQGEEPLGSGSTAPPVGTRIDPSSTGAGVPNKMPEGDRPILDLKAPVKEMKVEEVRPPVSAKPVEVPAPTVTPTKSAAADIPPSSGPMVDPVPPGPMHLPTVAPAGVPSVPPPSAMEVKTPSPVPAPAPEPIAPPAITPPPAGGPELAPPPAMPGPGK